ncbi:MAG: DNA/RNA nuclease SfsA [Deltaproteobacteria bacterium]|nr:DNA/RNA nuclease SfsA [Deltaproteobacteria bacterium]
MRLFANPETAYFLSRPNRFLVQCKRGEKTFAAFLPNSGRLLELLLPGRRLYLVKEGGAAAARRKTEYTVVAVEREGRPVMLHTHRTNDVVRYLLERGEVPGLEKARVKAAEVRVGQSRFDFLLEMGGERIFLEVKSCTLFGDHVAMFPDAVTARGTRHLRDLAALRRQGVRGAVVFVVHWPESRIFMPDYHTDLAFSRTLLAVRQTIETIPISVGWNTDLLMSEKARLLDIPWDYVERESKDRGSYLLILRLPRARSLQIGRLGRLSFPKGFYIYVGSAMRGLTGRIQRHRRLRKRPHWHIDALRAASEFHSALPVRSSLRLECEIAQALKGIGEWEIPGFGSSDCSCGTHLFGMAGDPIHSRQFHRLVQYFRMDRYEMSLRLRDLPRGGQGDRRAPAS